ncbi:HU family DNA-binding protein, partial [Bacteroides thetaiotaomicron]|uniref:HU family DNA-binding protein n=1 Tax=Bacteroides thetaiotaomicron TaxID=818 RepID=UPI001927477E
MAIQVKASLRKNPQVKKAAGKYYAQEVLAPEMTQRQIISQIADSCTVTGSDEKAVLDALMKIIKRNLANGSPVRLGDL